MSALHALHDPGVVARPDKRWGETPCAFITLKADHQLAMNRAAAGPDLTKFVPKETYELALNRATTAEAA